MARGDKDRYSSRDERGSSRERGDRGYGGGGGGRDRKDDRGRDRERERDRDRDSGRKRGRHDRESSRERGAKDRDGGGNKRKEEQRNKVNMGYDDDEEYGESGGGGGRGNERVRSASPPKVVDVEKIKPNTEENKGEISMSVDETNRVRAMLGLKPLNVGGGASGKPTQEEIAVENMRVKREEEDKAKELKELEVRLQKARTKRLLNEKLQGDTLGDVKAGEEEVVSAADWVNRSRKKAVAMEEERLLAKQRERILEEQEMELAEAGGATNGGGKAAAYGAENLAGLKVTHGAAAFEAGDSVILTLKDQALLEEDEHGRVTGLKDEDDELENVQMKEAERRKELEKEAVRAKRGAYQAYDDEEFEGEIGPGAQRKVLSHYDEAKKEGAKLTLGQGGTARDGTAAAGNGEEEKKKVLESLKVDVKDASEYYTTEEMAKFKKPKKMRKKKLRKREEAGTSSSLGLEAALHDSSSSAANGGGGGGASSSSGGNNNAAAAGAGGGGSSSGGGGDHGSRASRAARMAANEEADRGDKRKRFDTALARAGKRANEKLADSFAKPSRPAPPPPPAVVAPQPEPMAFAEELDSDLGASLARARRLAQMKDKAKARKSRDVGESVREAMMRKKVKTEAAEGAEANGNAGGSSMDVDEGGVPVKEEISGDGGMVFTSTTEFTSRLEATLQERKRDSIKAAEKLKVKQEEEEEAKKAKQAGGKHGKDGMDVDTKIEEEGGRASKEEEEKEKAKRSRWTTKKEDDDDDEEEPDAEELEAMLEGADSDDDDQLGFLHKQPLAKNGMAATLALLRPSGVLAEKFHRSGRAKDARKHHGEADETREDRESGAKLEYRDQWGREITRKEAFRNLCYQFHGYGSGKKKQEKRLKLVEEEKKKERAMDLQRLKTLQQTQEITKQAFVVVQGGSNTGAALPPPPPSLELKKKAQAKAAAAKMKKSETPAPV